MSFKIKSIETTKIIFLLKNVVKDSEFPTKPSAMTEFIDAGGVRKISQKFISENINFIYRPSMNKPMKFQSKMNGTAITLSEGEYKTKEGSLIACKYYGGLKQQWYMGMEQ